MILSFLLEYLHILPQIFYTAIDMIEAINDMFHNKQFKKPYEQMNAVAAVATAAAAAATATSTPVDRKKAAETFFDG